MIKSMKYFSRFARALLVCGMLAGCVNDKLNLSEKEDSGIFELAEDEYGLGVTISLGRLSGDGRTRALADLGEGGLADLEEYVNTDNLYILFFDLDGTFLFRIDKPVAVPIGQSNSGNDSQWFIRIPVKEINENLIRYIEENPFKIAVLANWTYDAAINTGGTWDAFEFHEPLDEDGNLKYTELGKLDGDHISLLAHAQQDNAYKNKNSGYDHLVNTTATGPHMGPYTGWVRNYHGSIKEADADIRAGYDVMANTYTNPDSKYIDANGNPTAINHFRVTYNKLWQLWVFGGAQDTRPVFGTGSQQFDAGAAQKSAWLELNGKAKESFVEQYTSGDDAVLKWTLPNDGVTQRYEALEITRRGIELNYKEPEDPAVSPDPMDFDGIVLTEENLYAGEDVLKDPLHLDGSRTYIHFRAYADGFVKVNYEATGGAKLYVHVGTNNTPSNNASHYQRDNEKARSVLNEDGLIPDDAVSDVSFDPEDVYIYMVKDPSYVAPEGSDERLSVTIYGIEFIESRHLYDSDRSAILPSKEYPIPMYGIQDFDPIGEYWEPGYLFNLSQYNNAQKTGYNYRNISLLRSLARVEVKLLKSAFPKKPSHVFMRSMNRSARITPVDFFTPTDIIWNGFNSASASDIKRLQNYINAGNLNEQHIIQSTPGHAQEEKNINQFGPIYIGTEKDAVQTDKMNEFRATSAWAFGIWESQWGWDWNRGIGEVDNFKTYQVNETRNYTGQTVPEYPRIFHPRIDRSDYARFTEIEDPDYWHYLMYVPEKNITDADNPGNAADRPKVIHVEIRFNGGFPQFDENGNPLTDDPENQVENFDDNGAYRLYFTEGGCADYESKYPGREDWDDYEYDLDCLKWHWPVMRNYVYQFTVTGGPTNRGNVNFQVSAPDQRTASWNFF